jgi:hypothetical protein
MALKPADPPETGGSRRWIISAFLLAIVALAAWAWWGLQSEDLLEQTLALQEKLLTGTLAGSDRKAAIKAVTYNVDHMDRAEVKKVRDTFNDQWRKFQTEAMDRYFAADDKERIAVLDKDIPVFVTAGDLWLATNPWASGPPRRRSPAKPTIAPKKPVSPEVEKVESYRTALVKRSAARGVEVPDWLLRPARR